MMVSAMRLSDSPGCTTLAQEGSWTPGGSGIVVVDVEVVDIMVDAETVDVVVDVETVDVVADVVVVDVDGVPAAVGAGAVVTRAFVAPTRSRAAGSPSSGSTPLRSA